MEGLYIFVMAFTYFVNQADGHKTYGDMFPHKHAIQGKLPFPILPIPGWDPDTIPWDEYLYPPLGPKPKTLTRRKGKPVKVRLTSDSPAISGSLVSFTAKLEYPPCQREDANGDLVWDSHCADASGQVHSGYVYNWTSWVDDYGFGKCTDLKRCNVFPDGKPFPQSNDWRRKSYVYVWHTMGQYHETCDGSSSSLMLNTTGFTLGAEVMEVLVYRKRERRKYSPLTSDSTIFAVTDKIPLVVNISQKAAANQSANIFYRDQDIVFFVQLHDPSSYLKTAASVDYFWDFGDGNKLVTHSNVATHAYSRVGTINVKLTVEAAFPIQCPPATVTQTPRTSTTPLPTETQTTPPVTPTTTSKMKTTHAPASTAQPHPSSGPVPVSTAFPTTGPLPATVAHTTAGLNTTSLGLRQNRQLAYDNGCFRYIYGNFEGNITIIEPKHVVNRLPTSRITDVFASKETDMDVSFLVKCFGSTPSAACTIVSDLTCTRVLNIACDDVPPSAGCEVRLRRRFAAPGTYCVNITLEDSSSLALASTTVTISRAQATPASRAFQSPHVADVVLTCSTVLVALFAFIAFMVYKRYKVYRLERRVLVENAGGHVGIRRHVVHLKNTIFPKNEETCYLLTDRHPL